MRPSVFFWWSSLIKRLWCLHAKTTWYLTSHAQIGLKGGGVWLETWGRFEKNCTCSALKFVLIVFLNPSHWIQPKLNIGPFSRSDLLCTMVFNLSLHQSVNTLITDFEAAILLQSVKKWNFCQTPTIYNLHYWKKKLFNNKIFHMWLRSQITRKHNFSIVVVILLFPLWCQICKICWQNFCHIISG